MRKFTIHTEAGVAIFLGERPEDGGFQRDDRTGELCCDANGNRVLQCCAAAIGYEDAELLRKCFAGENVEKIEDLENYRRFLTGFAALDEELAADLVTLEMVR